MRHMDCLLLEITHAYELSGVGTVVSGINDSWYCLDANEIQQLIGDTVRIRYSSGTEEIFSVKGSHAYISLNNQLCVDVVLDTDFPSSHFPVGALMLSGER